MGEICKPEEKKHSIATPEHEKILNIIDQIRAQGVSRYIDLPQIVVCGDQSSGKSSCLEGLCGLRFPTGDGLCTRFATEYILRRTAESSINIGISPDTERPESEKLELQRFKPAIGDRDRFPEIVEEAARCMGIQEGGKTFAHDVLRIEISGPGQDNLTLVDLPGIFHSSSKSQSNQDKKAVDTLVASYIKRPRSIILAVVSAKNDLNNQAVLDVAREHDRKGARTLGIITKPDTLAKNSPSEEGYFHLARNRDVKFAHGWHILRNCSFEEKESTTEERDQVEKTFFSQGRWRSLDAKHKGIHHLRLRLSKILYDHILAELPGLLSDLEKALNDCHGRLQTLGAGRSALKDQRLYLLRASQDYVTLISGAVNGTYTDKFFGSSSSGEGLPKRLRATAVMILKQFAMDMEYEGHAVDLVREHPADGIYVAGGASVKMTYEEYYVDVQERIRRNGGRELPGLYNHSIVRDLFCDQAKPWQRKLHNTKDELIDAAHDTVSYVLEHVVDESTIDGILREIVTPGLERLEQALSAKADEVLAPNLHGHPFTLNHTFVDNIQKLRREQTIEDISQKLESFFGVGPNDKDCRRFTGNVDIRRLRDMLVRTDDEDPDRFAAVECINAMQSYYQVAMNSLVDAFGIYAVEECLLSKLVNIFTPEVVSQLTDEVIEDIAAESDESSAEREDLKKKLKVLEEAQKALHRVDRRKASTSIIRGKAAKRRSGVLEKDQSATRRDMSKKRRI